MKVLAVVLAVFCAGAHAHSVKLTNKQLDDYIQECLAKNRLSQAFFKTDDENLKFLTEEQKSCFMACMLKKSNILTDTGNLSAAAMTDMDLETANAVERCQHLAEGHICKLAWCLHKTDKFNIIIIQDRPQYVG